MEKYTLTSCYSCSRVTKLFLLVQFSRRKKIKPFFSFLCIHARGRFSLCPGSSSFCWTGKSPFKRERWEDPLLHDRRTNKKPHLDQRSKASAARP